MRDIHVYPFETVDNVKFEKIKYNKSQFWSPYIYNLKVSLFCLFFRKVDIISCIVRIRRQNCSYLFHPIKRGKKNVYFS